MFWVVYASKSCFELGLRPATTVTARRRFQQPSCWHPPADPLSRALFSGRHSGGVSHLKAVQLDLLRLSAMRWPARLGLRNVPPCRSQAHCTRQIDLAIARSPAAPVTISSWHGAMRCAHQPVRLVVVICPRQSRLEKLRRGLGGALPAASSSIPVCDSCSADWLSVVVTLVRIRLSCIRPGSTMKKSHRIPGNL